MPANSRLRELRLSSAPQPAGPVKSTRLKELWLSGSAGIPDPSVTGRLKELRLSAGLDVNVYVSRLKELRLSGAEPQSFGRLKEMRLSSSPATAAPPVVGRAPNTRSRRVNGQWVRIVSLRYGDAAWPVRTGSGAVNPWDSFDGF